VNDRHVSPLVSFRGVSARVGQKEILHNLSFDVEAGETLVLLGRSGSGKTTFRRASVRKKSCTI